MTKKEGPGALAGATGADQDAAGQQPDLFNKSKITAPLPNGASGNGGAAEMAPNGAVSEPHDGADDAAEVGNAGRAGRALGIDDIEPWPESVDGAVLLDALALTIRRHVVLDANMADAVALWIVHTHAIDAAEISPRLAITSPEKRCGKTTLLYLLGALVARPLSTANMTVATLFRAIDAAQPTLLIDEADTFIGGADNMRGIINAGHSRATASVLRAVVDGREGWEPRRFNVWGAVALAAIGDLPGTIEDRALKIALRRRRPDEPVERLRIDRLHRYAALARQAARWAADQHDKLSEADPDVPAELHDRAADNWRSPLAIADVVGGEWPERARRAAVMLTRASADEIEAPGITLLADLRELFAAERSGVLFTREILLLLCEREDRPYAEFHRGRAITDTQLAALLKPYGIPRNKTVRRGNLPTAKGYRARDFADAWARYLPAREAVTRSQSSDSAAPGDPGAVTGGAPSVTPDENVTDGVTGDGEDVTAETSGFRGL